MGKILSSVLTLVDTEQGARQYVSSWLSASDKNGYCFYDVEILRSLPSKPTPIFENSAFERRIVIAETKFHQSPT